MSFLLHFAKRMTMLPVDGVGYLPEVINLKQPGRIVERVLFGR